jgi:hypothetical protein
MSWNISVSEWKMSCQNNGNNISEELEITLNTQYMLNREENNI